MIISFILYWIYIIINPKLPNVIFRKDDNNDLYLSAGGVFSMLEAPFKHSFYWQKEFLDINWLFFVITFHNLFLILPNIISSFF
jgi:hypothetical protein